MELNKPTKKDHFPLPFVDQFLDTLVRKKYFSFLDGFSRYNQIQISPKDQYKIIFTCSWGTFAYRVLPFKLCNAPTTFQREILTILSDLINEGIEAYMEDFIPYGNDFVQALHNIEKFLTWCIATRLSFSYEKCHMMMNEGIVLGHFIFSIGIYVDLVKIEVILKLPTPHTQINACSFLGYTCYYCRFVEILIYSIIVCIN